MSNHTPGPWSEPCNYSATRFEVQGDGKQVAVVNKIEDARLIAAATELLEICKQVVANGGTSDIAAMRAAIAKAEGGAA